MIKNKTLLMHLGSLVQLVLIGLTLWIVWQFFVGDIAHPMGFLSSVGVFPTEFDLFKPFASVPTFGAQGLMSVYLWPMYYITGVAVYLSICAFATTICIWTTSYAAGFTSPSAMTNLTSRPNHSQAESTDLSHAGIELHTDKLNHPIAEGYKFQVMRGDELANKLASYDDVSDFLDGCSIMRGSQEWHAAFAGVPIQVDGTTMRFIRI